MPHSREDHDLIIEINADVKHILEWNKSHSLDDEIKHQENLKKFDKINKTQEFHQRIIWGGLGGLAVLEFLLKFKP